MNYKLNLGSWNSVFAVPSEIVDKHLKLAGAAQLKVILWFLRHSGEELTVYDMAAALSMQEADVRDCMQYWIETGVISISQGIIIPAPPAEQVQGSASAEACAEAEKIIETPQPKAVPQTKDISDKQAKQKRSLSRPDKPDIKYLARRIDEDSSIAYLMNSADEIFGRITSSGDKAILLLIHEHDGLPVEVIIMLLQYAASNGKLNMRYIEKMAISWAEEEINTLELAEKKIERLTNGSNYAKLIQRTIGLDEHSPTEKEIMYASRWMGEWKFTTDMIRAAYERCVDSTGKYRQSYMNKILENWFERGIFTLEQASSEQRTAKTQKAQQSSGAAYDINMYESTSALDEEW